MKWVKKFKRKHYSWDEYCCRKSKDYLNGVNQADMEMHKVYNLVKIRKLKRAKKFLNSIESEFDEDTPIDHIAYAKYLRAKIADKENKSDQAEEYYQEIIDFGKQIKNETYLVPFAKHKLLILKIKQIEEDK